MEKSEASQLAERAPQPAPPRIADDLLAPENLRDPYPLYARLQREAAVHWSEPLQGWLVARYADVRTALGSDDLSAARFSPYLERAMAREHQDPDDARLFQALARWFTFADPPEHTRLRTVTRKVFSGPMKRMTPAVERRADDLLDRAERRGDVDLVADVARPLSLGAIAQLLGVPPADHPRFTAWSDVLTEFIGGALNVAERRKRALAGLIALEEYLGALVRERRRQPTQDIIGRLAHAEHEGAMLTDEEIVAIGAMLLFAGHGTTTNLIGNGTLALLSHPDQLQLLREEPALIPATVEELLRYDSPVQITVRRAQRDGALGVEAIKAGHRVFLLIAAANRDPREYDRSDRLDVTRSDRHHLSFGYGIHFCLGAPLARIEAPLLFERLLARFRRVELATPREELSWQPTVGFRGLTALPVRLIPG